MMIIWWSDTAGASPCRDIKQRYGTAKDVKLEYGDVFGSYGKVKIRRIW